MENPNLTGSLEITKPEQEELLHALASPHVKTLAQASALAAFRRLRFGYAEWLQEVRALGQMAMVEGNFKTSMETYQMLGKALGIQGLAPPSEQHNHVHLNSSEVNPKELSTDELKQRIAELRKRQQNATEEDVQKGEPDVGLLDGLM